MVTGSRSAPAPARKPASLWRLDRVALAAGTAALWTCVERAIVCIGITPFWTLRVAIDCGTKPPRRQPSVTDVVISGAYESESGCGHFSRLGNHRGPAALACDCAAAVHA